MTQTTNFTELKGKGVKAKIADEDFLIGNEQLLKDHNITLSEDLRTQKEKYEHQGKTVVIGVVNNQPTTLFVLADQVKENAKKTIQKAKKLGLKTVMISGDNKRTANFVGKYLGIDEIFGEILPSEKARIIKDFQKNNQKVAFAGDGINDAPALVQSDLGIAMGKGTDIAKEAGDIVLINNDPLKIIEAIELSKRTYKIIKQNLFWAFFYNSIAIPLAILGLVNPIIGSLAMAFSDVTVIGNALRLRRG